MKWFWYSLIGFCLLMCSCKTKKSAHLINEASKSSVQTKLFRYEALKDTFSVLKIEIDYSKLKITEIIKITEYDAQSGKQIKETQTKREITQDSDKVVSEKKEQTVTDNNQLDFGQTEDNIEVFESEVTKETEGASVAFWRGIGRLIGIIIAFVLGFKIFWPSLKKKLRE